MAIEWTWWPAEYKAHVEIQAYIILAAKPRRKNLYERPRSRWKEGTEMNFKQIRCEDVD
jgi:hypothetical protein